jgi:hypothetical protein
LFCVTLLANVAVSVELPLPVVLVSCTTVMAELPNVRLLGERLTAGASDDVPLPVKLITWGLPEALSVIVMLPDWAPVAVGVKVTLIEQVPFTGRVDGLMGQLFVCANCVLAAMLEMLSAALPVLVSVTDCDPLVVFTG